MSSTMMSIDGSSTIEPASPESLSPASARTVSGLCLAVSRTAMRVTRSSWPVRSAIASDWESMSRVKAVPTLPYPSSPTCTTSGPRLSPNEGRPRAQGTRRARLRPHRRAGRPLFRAGRRSCSGPPGRTRPGAGDPVVVGGHASARTRRSPGWQARRRPQGRPGSRASSTTTSPDSQCLPTTRAQAAGAPARPRQEGLVAAAVEHRPGGCRTCRRRPRHRVATRAAP